VRLEAQWRGSSENILKSPLTEDNSKSICCTRALSNVPDPRGEFFSTELHYKFTIVHIKDNFCPCLVTSSEKITGLGVRLCVYSNNESVLSTRKLSAMKCIYSNFDDIKLAVETEWESIHYQA
jgi:hypothetical protein